MNVPLIDLKAQYLNIRQEIDEATRRVIESGNYIGGEEVSRFERQFAKLYNTSHCISLANGTDALYIALKALGIGKGDEVITTCHSWVSTASTIVMTGAEPVFVDTDQYFTIDAEQVEKAITKNTKAIVPVHLFGQMADMKSLGSLCQNHNLYCIEDSAQTHLALHGNHQAGSIGDIATFSFYPTKQLGAYGDAGALITNDDTLAQKCRQLASYGFDSVGDSNLIGINSRLDPLQAAILQVKLKYLDFWNEKRREVAHRYNQLLGELDTVQCPKVRPNASHTYYAYVIKCERRDKLKTYLETKGIQTKIHYEKLLPHHTAFASFIKPNQQFPNAIQYLSKILSLPIFPAVTTSQIDYVSNCIHDFYKKSY